MLLIFGNGMLLKGSNVDAVVGYGKNHEPRVAVGAAVIRYGKGEIVLLGLPRLDRAFLSVDPAGFQPVTAKRLVFNALNEQVQ